MKQVLIVDPDDQFMARFFTMLISTGDDYVVSATSVMREACLIVAQQPQDLAFISAEDDDSLLRALRSLQPDLPVVVLVQGELTFVPEWLRQQTQGVLRKPVHLAELLEVIHTALHRPVPFNDALPLVGEVNDVLQQAHLMEKVLTALVTHKAITLTHTGTLNDRQVNSIAAWINMSWRPNNTAQIQFLRLPDRSTDLLTYTRPVADNLLTLVAFPDVPISHLRQQADDLALRLSDNLLTQNELHTITSHVVTPKIHAIPSFAIAWRPVENLPTMLHIPLRRAMERLAEANACILSHLEIRGDLVHIVVQAPPGRNSAWVAHIFKNGAEEEIQKQFGVRAHLWNKGYYAIESSTPLGDEDFALFLSS